MNDYENLEDLQPKDVITDGTQQKERYLGDKHIFDDDGGRLIQEDADTPEDWKERLWIRKCHSTIVSYSCFVLARQ